MKDMKGSIAERTIKRLKRLEVLINPIDNHAAYREYLKVWVGEMEDEEEKKKTWSKLSENIL